MKNINVILFVLILLLMRGFDLVFLNLRILDYLCTLVLFYYTFLSFKTKSEYRVLILLFALSLLVSCISSDLTKGQSFLRTVINSFSYWGLLFYFTLVRYQPTIQECKKILLVLSLMFCFCYVLQWLIYPTVLFTGVNIEGKVSADKFRMRMSGSILCYLLYFWGINTYLTFKKKKYLLYSLIGFLPILIMGFRSLIACTIIGTLIMSFLVTKKISRTFIYTIVGVIIAAISYVCVPIVNQKVNEMILRQQTDNFNNDDYIRIISFNYFMENSSITDKIFGGGVPDTKSNYGKEIFDLQEKGFYLADLGLIGLMLTIGLLSVIFLSMIIAKCIIQCKSKDTQFIRFTLLSVYIASIFTSMELYRNGNFVIIALLLYYVTKRNAKTGNYTLK